MAFTEWGLSSLRVHYISVRRIKSAVVVAFVEEVLGFAAVYIAVAEMNPLLILISALGASSGLYVSLKTQKEG